MSTAAKITSVIVLGAMGATLVTACGAKTDPTSAATNSTASGPTIVIGTANFPESEIIGHIWADALAANGFKVEVKDRIGSREVYLKALEEGSVDIVPEYSGNLAEFLIKKSGGQPLPAKATEEQVIAGVKKALPAGLAIGQAAPGESKDSFRVTEKFAKEHGVASIADLAKVGKFTLAANPEIVKRPFGPDGLASVYGIESNNITVKPISDSGGPLTVKALVDGTVQVANVYTTSPTFDTAGNQAELVTLTDPENLILPQHVVPLMRGKRVPARAREVLAGVDKNLTTEALLAMNTANIGPAKEDVDAIAAKFVKEHPVTVAADK